MNIYQKLVEVRKVVPYLQKGENGPQFKYVSSSQVLAAVKAKMDEIGLLLIPSVTGHKVSESVVEFHDNNGNVNKRTTTYFTELDLTMTWINAEKPDETILCQWYGQGVDIAGEKGVGKALTYGEKYFMLKFFNIPTDKDDPDSFQKKYGDEEPEPQLKPEHNQDIPKKLTEPQIRRAFTIGKSKGLDEKYVKSLVLAKYKKTNLADLTKTEYDELCKGMENMENKGA